MDYERSEKRTGFIGALGAIIFGLFATVVLSVLIEGISFLYLSSSRLEKKSFLIGAFSSDLPTPRPGTTHIDPHLGYARGDAFVRFGEESQNALRIVTLGGSTTDSKLEENNWVKHLADLFKKDGDNVVIYNGAVRGYSSHQELLKLIRDVLPLHPDLVISLTGENDLRALYSLEKHPMVHPYQDYLFHLLLNKDSGDSFLFPNTVFLLKKQLRSDSATVQLNYGPPNEGSPASHWERNQRMMNALAKEFGSTYLAFLQPTSGVGSYVLSPEEQKELEKLETRWPEHQKRLREFYNEAIPKCKSLSFCIDLTELFSDKKKIYRDPRHPTPEGYQLIASSIYDEHKKRLGKSVLK